MPLHYKSTIETRIPAAQPLRRTIGVPSAAMSPTSDPEKAPGASDGYTSSSSVHSDSPTREKHERAEADKFGHADGPFDNYDPSHDVRRDELEPDADDDDEEIGPDGAHQTPAQLDAALYKTQTSGSTASRPPDFEVTFGPDDPENPKNWPMWYQVWVLVVISLSCWIVVLYSTSYTASIPGLMREFNASKTYTTLGMTTYLLGLATGCLVVAPLSELYGRQRVYLVCMFCSSIMIIPCGLANSLEQQFASRFVGWVSPLKTAATSY
jgi:MFS transporter